MSENKKGKVHLVGAGPGDPDLLTIKAQKILQTVDVVIFDYLVNPAILQNISNLAERVFIGKPGSPGRLSQMAVNQLMINHASEGKSVARLKCGDPFIFGRGGEEAEALVAAGVDWEMIPGISSGNAATAYAGIPLTHRNHSSSVAFVTGHEATDKEFSAQWDSLARAVETLVIYMGVKTLPNVVSKLILAGLAPSTPIAVVEKGTCAEQRVVIATLGTIIGKAQEQKIKSPATTVVGNVVKLRNDLKWFSSELDLEGKIGAQNEILSALS